MVLGTWTRIVAYSRLAEAVVDARDGQTEAAAVALAERERAVESTGWGSVIRVGNDWAVERLQAQLRGGADDGQGIASSRSAD